MTMSRLMRTLTFAVVAAYVDIVVVAGDRIEATATAASTSTSTAKLPSHILPIVSREIKFQQIPKSMDHENFFQKDRRNSGTVDGGGNGSIINNNKLDGRTLQTSSVTATPPSDDGGTCVDAPFLWLIRNDNAGGTVEGVGVGTVHLPRRFVMTDNEWQSLVNAAADGCTIFAEFDLDDVAALNNALANCPVSTDLTFLPDIPDPAFQAEVRRKITQIVEEYSPFGPTEQTVEVIVTSNPLAVLYQLINYWNIQNNLEIRDQFFENLFNQIVNTDFLDTELVGLGFDAGGLETADETCSYIQAIQPPSKEQYVSNWDELYADKAWANLNNTLDTLLDSYQCGDIDKLNEAFTESFIAEAWDNEEEVLAALLDVRNIKMAERMVLAMEASEHIPMFAVGAAHWFIGENSLSNLLQQSGYSLERVLEPYEASLFPDAECEFVPIVETTDEPIITTNAPVIEPTDAPVTEPTSAPVPEPTDEPVTTTAATASPTPESTSLSTAENTGEPSNAHSLQNDPKLHVVVGMSLCSIIVSFVAF